MVIAVPDALRSSTDDPNMLAAGPFVVSHGDSTIGGLLERAGDELTLWDGSRTYLLDNSYTATTDGDIVTFHSDQWDSTFVIRPIEESDFSWIPDADQFPNLEGLVDGLRNNMLDDLRNA